MRGRSGNVFGLADGPPGGQTRRVVSGQRLHVDGRLDVVPGAVHIRQVIVEQVDPARAIVEVMVSIDDRQVRL